MIYEWKPADGVVNFGDHIPSKFISKKMLSRFDNDENFLICPIGSVLNQSVLEYARYKNLTPIFLFCGWDGSALDAESVKSSIIIGARGPITRSLLADFDKKIGMLGDPGYVVPSIVSPLKTKAQSRVRLFVPHGVESKSRFPELVETGAEVASPFLQSDEDFWMLLSKIQSADFVLTGAMHVAIAAHAFGIPFAIFRSPQSPFVDHPVKWVDWLNSIGVEDVTFSSTFQEGVVWYEKNFPEALKRKKSTILKRSVANIFIAIRFRLILIGVDQLIIKNRFQKLRALLFRLRSS